MSEEVTDKNDELKCGRQNFVSRYDIYKNLVFVPAIYNRLKTY